LRGLDHRDADPVLHRPAGIEELGFGVDRSTDSLRHLAQADQRGPADGLEDVVVRPKVLRHWCPAWRDWYRASLRSFPALAESRAALPLDSATLLDSATSRPVESTNIRNTTSPSTLWSYSVGGYWTGESGSSATGGS